MSDKTTILVVGHGSPDPEAIEHFHNFVMKLSEKMGQKALCCFLEFNKPDVLNGIAESIENAEVGGNVLILPLFLGRAGHQKNDIASALQWARLHYPGVSFRLAAPLAPHANLIAILNQRIYQALTASDDTLPLEETGILVVGRGSSDPGANSEVARSAYLLFDQHPYKTVEYAFQAVAHPTIEEGLLRCSLLGARQIVVAPYVLFNGKVVSFIHEAADTTAHEQGLKLIHAEYLGVNSLLIDIAIQRLKEAENNTTTMNCDLCKYRQPMFGYEHQVGEAQLSHHLFEG